MQTTYVLIDYENVQVKSLALLKGDHFRVMVFLGPKNTKIGADLAMAMQALGSRAEYVKLDASSHNALDFHITYYLGGLVAMDANGKFFIISKDTGFDSLIKHIKQRKIDCARAVSIEDMLGVKVLPVEKVVVKKITKVAVPEKPIKTLSTPELVKKISGSLMKRKIAIPRTEKTLKNLVKSLCGNQCSENQFADVYAELLKVGIVAVEGTKVSYRLPD